MFGNAFKPRAHYVFNYKPRYYDERKERLEKLKEKYENKDSTPIRYPKNNAFQKIILDQVGKGIKRLPPIEP